MRLIVRKGKEKERDVRVWEWQTIELY